MWISRIRVNGGFLSGLDVELADGLNVIVGSRGVGKTTFLELIRHALGVPYADRSRAAAQARVIQDLLGTGEVVLDLNTAYSSTRIVVDAAGAGRLPDSDFALMLGQNELEEIASTPASRLQLIDIRAGIDTEPPRRDSAIAATVKLFDTQAELGAISDRTDTQESLISDFGELRAQEEQILAEAAPNLKEARDQLRVIDSQLSRLTDQLSEVADARLWLATVSDSFAAYSSTLEDVRSPSAATLFGAALAEPLERLESLSRRTDVEIQGLYESLAGVQNELLSRENELRLDAEPIRSWLEETESGLGQLTTRLRNLQTQITENDRLNKTRSRLQHQFDQLFEQRKRALREIEAWQEEVFKARNKIARKVSQELGSRVIVTVDHLASSARFEDTLVKLLQGSHLQYRQLARTIATTVLPTQLLRFIETESAESLSRAAGIGVDRASRVIGFLNGRDALAELTSVLLDDLVDFKLRDGGVDKSVSKMSTGQKCAVTLPIVLSETERILILDQPEDHLDNAYLVDNVITGIVRRTQHRTQTIVATHNANIPVIGSAECVFYLESDGTTGRIIHHGRFDNPNIVQVITRVMEGGRDAFKRRMAFYEKAGQLP